MTDVHIPKRGPGHCDSDHHWSDFAKRHDGSKRPGPNMTDFNLANMVFLAGRDDADLGMYQMAAKGRIRWLSIELALAQEKAATAVAALEAIVPLSRALRINGPDQDDLQELHTNLDSATSIADEALAEINGAKAVATPAPSIPEAPWPATPLDCNNAKREGWKAFFTGRARGDCPFPPASPELWKAFGVGWDAAEAHRP